MREKIKLFEDFALNTLNEYGGDSGGALGTVKINGVKTATFYRAAIDTPDYISYSININVNPELMVKIGIWSDTLMAEEDGEGTVSLFDGSKSFSEKALLNNFGEDSVRNIKDDDIAEFFSARIDKVVKDSYTLTEFIKVIKRYDSGFPGSNIKDWRILNAEQITELKAELKDKQRLVDISTLLASFTPKEALAIAKRKNMPEEKLAKLQKLTKKKGEDLLKYVEDSIENAIHEALNTPNVLNENLAPHLLDSFQDAEKLSDEDGIVLTGVTGDMTHVEAAIKDIPHVEAYVLITDKSGPATSYKSDVFLVGGKKEDAMTIKEYFNKNEEAITEVINKPSNRIIIDKKNFEALVFGEEVNIAGPQGNVKIILQDIGLDVMMTAFNNLRAKMKNA
jgi:hypothetical protein